jgi:hypothetical protein
MKMKRILALVLVFVLMLTVAGCGASSVKSGLATLTAISKSTDLAADANGFAQVDSITAAVTVDGSGKVLSVIIDSTQSKVEFDKDGKIVTDKATAVPTKKELGSAYGMKKASPIGRDWHEEITDLEKWMVGKTADQISNMKVKEVEGKPGVPDETDLTSKVTISVGDYQKVVVKAIANAK